MDRAHRRLQPLSGQRGAHHFDLPIRNESICRVLQLASTTGFVVTTRCLDPLVRGRLDTDICQKLIQQRAADDLTRQGARSVNGAISDAVALMTKAGNSVGLRHGVPDTGAWPATKPLFRSFGLNEPA
jgi:hypothetical protein